MPTNALKELKKGFGRKFLRKEETLGPIVAQLQDHVEDLDVAAGLAALAQGSIYIGDASNLMVPLSVKGNAKVLLGNGTTATSVSVSGDVTIDNAGVVTVGANKITGDKASVVVATKSIFVPLATIATTGAQEFTIPVPHASTLIGAKLCAKDSLATDDTNFLTFALTNKGQSGAGSTAMLSATASGTTKTTGGAAIAAYTTRNLPLHATGGNAVVAANDCLALSVTASGTLANTVTEGRIRLDFQVTT